MATDNKYDRQLRLWGAAGQKALAEAHGAFMSGGGLGHRGITIDTAPFVVHDYDEGSSFTPVKTHLGAKGFPLTKAQGLNAMLEGLRNER